MGCASHVPPTQGYAMPMCFKFGNPMQIRLTEVGQELVRLPSAHFAEMCTHMLTARTIPPQNIVRPTGATPSALAGALSAQDG